MKKNYVGTMSAAVAIGMLGVYGCSTGKDSVNYGRSPASTPAPAVRDRAAGLKSAGLRSDGLKPGENRSSLDALQRGVPPTSSPYGGTKDVYFDFDRYDLDSEDRAILRASAEWLKKTPAAQLQIEGHCDERGTTEYNLALGAKRAAAAKDYLVTLGIAPARISTISYGEEIPVCREQGESCWQRNRRDRFVTVTRMPGA